MVPTLESAQDPARSNIIQEGETGPPAESQDQQIGRKRKREGDDPITRTPPTQLPLDGSTCAKCGVLDLGRTLQGVLRAREILSKSRKLELDYGIAIIDVGHRYRQLHSTDCALCRVLFASRIRRENDFNASNEGDEIRLISFLRKSGLVRTFADFGNHDSEFIAVVPKHFGTEKGSVEDWDIIRTAVHNGGAAVIFQDERRPTMFAAQPVSPSFEADIANGWLRYCKANHSTLCGSLTSSPVSSLRLIDCATLSIREGDVSSVYVALSYVWGNLGNVDTKLRYTDNGLLLPERLSLVVSDAIRVTKALGFQYLWVDKFCINQNDPDAKHQQIQQMNAIYENADLTIVAAAGEDDTYGLPGVSERSRTPQKNAFLNGLSIISTMKHPHISIRSSRWVSRGWTFQEAALSRRRLVFTKEQLYFECNTMNCFESVCSPLDMLHTKDRSESLDKLRAGMFGRGKTDANFHLLDVYHEYISAIQDYTSRDLRYDSDSLNAFQGIIQRYSRLKKPFNAIWGIPYPVNLEERSWYFCASLSWSHTRSCWEDSRRPRRRYEFPSWTWAGWAGAVQIKQGVYGTNNLWGKNRVKSIKLGHGGDEKDLRSLESTDPEPTSHVLRLFAKALPPTLISCKLTRNGRMSWAVGRYDAELFPSQDSMRGAQFTQELMDVESWRCIWVCEIVRDNFFIVLQHNHDTDKWTRAGMLRASCYDGNMESLMENTSFTWFEIE